jgi:hypothetical protein
MTTADVAASSDRIEARPKTIGDAQPRTDPPTGGIEVKDLEPRLADVPGAPAAAADRSPMVLGTSCTMNPMLDRNARLVPIDYENGPWPPSMALYTLRRIQKRAATNTGFASPGCAAPSGFLNLLTRCSARNLSGLVSCR